MANELNDALCLLRLLRGRHLAHTPHMIQFLEALADAMASARRGTKINMGILTSFLGISEPKDEAVVRVLLLLMATRSFTEGQLRSTITQLRTTQQDRRKPIKPAKQPRDREARQLF